MVKLTGLSVYLALVGAFLYEPAPKGHDRQRAGKRFATWA